MKNLSDDKTEVMINEETDLVAISQDNRFHCRLTFLWIIKTAF